MKSKKPLQTYTATGTGEAVPEKLIGHRVLAAMTPGTPMTATEISKASGVKVTTVRRWLCTLQAQGCVKK